MAFSFGLIAKGLVGVLSVSAPIAVGVYYKDEILGTNKATEGEKKTTDANPKDESKSPQSEGGSPSGGNQKPSDTSGETNNNIETQGSQGTGADGEQRGNSAGKNPTSPEGVVDNNSGDSTQKEPSQASTEDSGTGNGNSGVSTQGGVSQPSSDAEGSSINGGSGTVTP